MKNLIQQLLLFHLATTTAAFVVQSPLLSTTSSPLKRRTLFTEASSTRRHYSVDKDVYEPSKVDEGGKYDSIVIGSGIGGLTAASLLAQAGQKVLVLEQHYVAGGGCHAFTRKGYEFATGIHYVGGQVGSDDDGGVDDDEGVSLKHLLHSVALPEDPIVWDRMDDVFETVYIGDTKYEIPAGEENRKAMLLDAFPSERGAIEKYFKLVKKVESSFEKAIIMKSLPRWLSRLLIKTRLYRLLYRSYRPATKRTVNEQLSKLTKNKDLRALLASNYPDYGTEPGRAPFLMQALVAAHYMEGAYYPRGGPSNIAKKIIPTITSSNNNGGGKVLVSAPVKRIVLDDETNRAVGVEMETGQLIQSDAVISDAGFVNTVENLLPPGLVDIEFAMNTKKEEEGDGTKKKKLLHPATTGFNLFVGLQGDAESLNLPRGVTVVHPTNDLSATARRVHDMTLEEAIGDEVDPKDFLVGIGCPATEDTTWKDRHPNKCTLEVITLCPYHWFERFADAWDPKTKSHGPEYEKAKRKLAEKIWDRTVQVWKDAKLPKTLQELDYCEVGSPLSFAHYYNSPQGSWYGLDMDLQRFEEETFFVRLRPELPEVANLFLTGQDVSLQGLQGAAFGGLMCAGKVLGVANVKSLLRDSNEDQGLAAASLAAVPLGA